MRRCVGSPRSTLPDEFSGYGRAPWFGVHVRHRACVTAKEIPVIRNIKRTLVLGATTLGLVGFAAGTASAAMSGRTWV